MGRWFANRLQAADNRPNPSRWVDPTNIREPPQIFDREQALDLRVQPAGWLLRTWGTDMWREEAAQRFPLASWRHAVIFLARQSGTAPWQLAALPEMLARVEAEPEDTLHGPLAQMYTYAKLRLEGWACSPVQEQNPPAARAACHKHNG